MRGLRSIAILLLTCLGLAAGVGAVLWGASLSGLARAEVVGTDALAPAYEAGDLVIVTRVPTAQLRAGDIVSASPQGADRAQLARVVYVEARSEGRWSVAAAARAGGDASEQRMGSQAWAPTMRLPLVGGITSAIVEPGYGIPLAAGALLLAAVVVIGRAPAPPVRRRA